MDFDLAAKRLARDHSNLGRGGPTTAAGGGARTIGGRRSGGGNVGLGIPAKAKREADRRQKLLQQRVEEKQARQRELEYQQEYVRSCERNLKVRKLTATTTTDVAAATTPSLFVPTSIYGDGDKITLPPSVLEHLSTIMSETSSSGTSPWTFRIGILNPDYVFPASPTLQQLKPPKERDLLDNDDDDMDESDESDDDDDDESNSDSRTAAYLDELRYKYLAYTHGTVVEFTQEEGQVGLPKSIATALLSSSSSSITRRPPTTVATSVRVKRTVDPAGNQHLTEDAAMSDDNDNEKTAGHLAWGEFDVPDMPVEISLVELPKGKACTLVPSQQAISNGFYELDDIKLVLEQSLVRTRATLSVGDVVHTWHRGEKFDLVVTAVEPSTYQAILCINTDIEVEFGQPEHTASDAAGTGRVASTTDATAGGAGGRKLLEPTPPPSTTHSSHKSHNTKTICTTTAAPLLPEPPLDQTDGVCNIQIRWDRASGKRRFDIHHATVGDLYAFAESVFGVDRTSFQLVTRYPRRIIDCDDASLSTSDVTTATTLNVAGFASGQELLLLEKRH